MNDSATNPAAAPAPAATTAAQTIPQADRTDVAGPPPKMLEAMAEDMAKLGATPEQIAAQVAKENGAAPAPKPAPTVDVPGFPAGRHQDFKFPHMTDEAGNYSVSADKAMREWLVTGGFPVGIGNFIASKIHETGQQYEARNPPGKQMFERAEMAKLERSWGGKTAENVALARQLVQEIDAKQKGFADLMKKTGAIHSAIVLQNLHMHASRLLDVKYAPGSPDWRREQSTGNPTARGSAADAIFRGVR